MTAAEIKRLIAAEALRWDDSSDGSRRAVASWLLDEAKAVRRLGHVELSWFLRGLAASISNSSKSRRERTTETN